MKHQQTQTRTIADEALQRAQGTGAGSEGEIQHVVVDIPLATIKEQTTAVAFNIFTPPPDFKLIRTELNVIQDISGGAISAATASVGTTEGLGTQPQAFVANTNVFTGQQLGPYATPGTNPQVTVANPITMTITTTSDTPSNATTGHLSVGLYFVVQP